MKCKNCGQELDDNLRYCRHCGTPVAAGDGGREKNLFLSLLEKIGQNNFTILAVLGMMAVGAGAGFCIKTLGDRMKADSSQEVRETGTVPQGETALETEAARKAEAVSETGTAPETEAVLETEAARKTEAVSETETEAASQSEAASAPETGEETQAPAPVTMSAVVSVTATSSLSEYNMTHSPDRLCDGNLSQAWVEGGAGQGIGEGVTFEFDGVYQVSGFVIYAGYQKSADLYQKNSRPAQLNVLLPGGSEEVYFLEDMFGGQNISLNSPVTTDEITFTIRSVYPGSKYEDTVISELSLY